MSGNYADINVGVDGHVATVEIDRPPHNFFDRYLMEGRAVATEGRR